MMAQSEATQNEAKRKAVEREANKEIGRKEKEKRAEQVSVRKEDRVAKKVLWEQAEAEHRGRRGNRRVGVDAEVRGEGASTGDEGASVAGEGAWDSIAGANCTHYRSPLVGGTSPYTDSTIAPSLPRPPSPLCMIQVHPPLAVVVFSTWAPQFHGPANSPFLFNSVMAMQ